MYRYSSSWNLEVDYNFRGEGVKKTPYRTIKSLPEADRPRERFLKLGPEAISDSELIAIILGTGTKQSSALDLANSILSNYVSIFNLLQATISELCEIPGIGYAKSIKLKAAFELANRCMAREQLTMDKITSPEDIFRLMNFRLKTETREHFLAVMLNTKSYLLKIDLISIGSLNATIVHPREVFNRAIRASACGVILVHNHPSGDPEPSQDDIKLTNRLVAAGDLLGIPIMDHVIIGHQKFYSFSRENHL